MCMEHVEHCRCGGKEISFHFQDDILSPEVIAAVHCPFCGDDFEFDPATMIRDNGWVIEYDLEVARFLSHRLPAHVRDNLTPQAIFDGGYATWRGIYPGDHIDSVVEREEIIKLAKVDPRAYFERMKNWANERMARLAAEGWRKANAS